MVIKILNKEFNVPYKIIWYIKQIYIGFLTWIIICTSTMFSEYGIVGKILKMLEYITFYLFIYEKESIDKEGANSMLINVVVAIILLVIIGDFKVVF